MINSGTALFLHSRFCFGMYSKISNRCGLWNSRGGWKKYQRLIVGEGGGGWGADVGIVRAVGKN